jgi:hypothetical protein
MSAVLSGCIWQFHEHRGEDGQRPVDVSRGKNKRGHQPDGVGFDFIYEQPFFQAVFHYLLRDVSLELYR